MTFIFQGAIELSDDAIIGKYEISDFYRAPGEAIVSAKDCLMREFAHIPPSPNIDRVSV